MALWFQFISNDYYYYVCIGIAFNAFALVMIPCFVDESPLYLMKKGEFQKAQVIIERIYRLNGTTEIPNLIDSLNIPKGQDKDSVSAMSYIRRPAVFVNLIVVTYFWASSSFDYYLTTFMLKYLNGDVF